MIVEKDIQRLITKRYIDADPTEIALIPRRKFKTDAGSIVMEDGPPRAVQTFKTITTQFTAHQGVPTITIDGHEHVIGAYLLGTIDSVMEIDDYWIGEDGRRWQIIALMDGHGWEKKAAVEIHGA